MPAEREEDDPNWSADGNLLLFGRSPDEEPAGAGPIDLETLDLRTKAISKVPGSEGLWSARWSPTGRYIAAFTQKGDRLMLFDFKTQKWSELAKASVGYPEWSRQEDYIYFSGTGAGGQGGVFRVRISDRKLDQVISLKDLHQLPWRVVRQRPEQERVDHAENGGVGADAGSEGQHCHQAHNGAAAQHPPAKTQVLKHFVLQSAGL